MDDFTSSFPIINNRYQIHRTIASGGMAVIYLAQDLLLERKVALKVLRRDFSDNQEFQNSFRSEAKASAKLSHPNIVTTYDFGIDAERLYIVMEFVEGTDLKTFMVNEKVLNMKRSLYFLIQAGKGLGYAHRSGFVHCDVKPQNMLVSAIGVLKIADFGIARAMDTISRDERYDVVWGSPYYFSPEQAKGLPPSPATDIYSLGIIAYELFTGDLPFKAEDSLELARMHRESKPIPPKFKNRSLPDTLNDFILKSISKNPDDRFSDGNTFIKALNSLDLHFEKSYTSNKNPHKKDLLLQHNANSKQNTFNWSTILLSFLALILAGGLIPFWIYIFFSINR